jgi:hypothetical protein
MIRLDAVPTPSPEAATTLKTGARPLAAALRLHFPLDETKSLAVAGYLLAALEADGLQVKPAHMVTVGQPVPEQRRLAPGAYCT